MGANLILPAGSAAAADSTPAEDPVVRSLRWDDGNNSNLYKATGSTNTTWTVAMWIKRSKLSSLQYFFSWGGDGINFDSSDRISIWNGSAYRYTTAVFRDTSSWYHLTISCNAGTITIYVNGVAHALSSSVSYPALGNVYFGRWSGITSYNFDGYLADIYGIEGSALDHTSFTESNDYGGLKPKAYTGSFGNNGFHIDAQPAHDADLLVSSIDRNDGDTQFVDLAQGHNLTGSNAEHSIAVGNPFTGDDRAIYFNGSSALTMPDSTDWEPSGDFTYEAWIMPTWSSAPAYSFPFGHGASSGQNVDMGHGVIIKSGTLYLAGWFGSTYHHPNYSNSGSGFAVSANEWTHVAVVRDGNTIRYYKNGVQQSTFTVSGSATAESNVFALGRTGSLTSYSYTGYIADFRITHDAEYPSGTTFTTPTAPHSSTSDTKVRIQPQLSDTTWHDEEGNHTISTVGSPTRTASSPYEAAAKSTAIYIPASSNYSDSNYLETSVSTDFSVGTGAYTLEGWIYIPTDYTGNFTPFGHYGADITMHGKTIGCYANSAAQDSSTSVDIGEWKHVAVVRESTSSNGGAIYYDGNRIHQFTHSANLSAAVEVALSGQNGQYWNQTAYYYDVRLTKGTARYTGSTYTVPSAPFELNPVYIGGDQSGNKNHFQPTNISGHDVMPDVPYPKNYSTWDAVQKDGGSVFSEGNLKTSSVASNNYHPCQATFNLPDSTGWYAEFYVVTNDGIHSPIIGVQDSSRNSSTLENIYVTKGVGLRRDGVILRDNSSVRTGLGGTSNGDIIMVAYKDRKIWFGRNGSWFHSGDPANDSNESTTANAEISGYHFAINCFVNGQTVANFGQDPTFAGNKTSGQDTSQSEFYYAPPTGFKSLNSSNLDAPTVTPSEHFDILTYTGNSDLNYGSGSTQNVTGVNFDVGMAWIKGRDNSSSGYTYSGSDEYGHYLFDTITGTGTGGYNLDNDVVSSGSGPYLNSGYYGVTSFSAGSGTNRGITVDEAGETNFDYDDGYYQLTERYVAWLWKLGSTGSSSTWNSSYTAPSTEHYNADAGVTTIEVSPVSSGNLEVAHSLSAAPEFFFVGHDSYGNFSGYPAFHKDLTSGYYLQLDGNSAQSSDSTYFPSGAAHADYIKLGSVFADSYGYGGNLRIWAFTGVEGYSKFGKYTGNGFASGSFIYTGFRPALVITKNISNTTGYHWRMWDSARGSHNVNDEVMYPSTYLSESTSDGHIDFLSNGFKLRSSNGNLNNNTYIYAAFAEQPFAAPNNAR